MNITASSFVAKITTDRGINYLNIFLMLISVVAAYIIPFELFLFSYAVLGPLHYLTEISWLEKKNFFVKSKADIWLFVLLVIFITVGIFNRQAKANDFVASFLFLAFVYGLIIVLVDNLIFKIVFAFVAFVFSVVLGFNNFPNLPFILFAVWLPTIIHVYVFTGFFMLYGALKAKSSSGIFSVGIFILCAITFFIYTPDHVGIPVSVYGQRAYSLFTLLNKSMYEILGYGTFTMDADTLYFGEKSIVIMRFIAFAYTYHYLNWFSKTTVIKWNDVSKIRMTMIIVLWIASVVLYAYSYKTGFYALFLLSMLHVFLEFPLNHRSFIGVFQELKSRFNK